MPRIDHKAINNTAVIIATSSETGIKGTKKMPDYSATKGAINAFTKSLAIDLLERQIRVNAVAPGPVWTPLNPSDAGATAKEAGEPKFEVTSWNAIFAPAGTPADVIATLNKALNEVLADPEVKKKALELGIDARGSTPQEIQERLKDDIVKWTGVIEKAGIQKR